MVNSNRGAEWDFGGRVVARPADDERHARARIAELLAKAIDRARSTRRCARASTRRCASSSRFYGELDRAMAITGRRAARAMRSSRAATPRRRAAQPLPLDELLAWTAGAGPFGSAALPFLFENYFRQADADDAAGRRHGPDRPRALRAGPADGAAEQPGHAPSAGSGAGADRTWPAARSREADYCICTLARAPAGSGSRAISRRPRRRRSAASLICRASRSASKARASGKRRAFYGGLALDRPAQRECDLSVGRFPLRPKGVLVGAYVAGWTAATIRARSPR